MDTREPSPEEAEYWNQRLEKMARAPDQTRASAGVPTRGVYRAINLHRVHHHIAFFRQMNDEGLRWAEPPGINALCAVLPPSKAAEVDRHLGLDIVDMDGGPAIRIPGTCPGCS